MMPVKLDVRRTTTINIDDYKLLTFSIDEDNQILLIHYDKLEEVTQSNKVILTSVGSDIIEITGSQFDAVLLDFNNTDSSIENFEALTLAVYNALLTALGVSGTIS